MGNTLDKIIPNGDKNENKRIGVTFNSLRLLFFWLAMRKISNMHKILLKQVNLIYSVTSGNAKRGVKTEAIIIIR